MDVNFLMSLASEEIKLFPDMPTIIWTTINFLILLGALYYFLYKPLLGAIASREDHIETTLKKAAHDRAEAERLRAEFEFKIGEAHKEAQEIVVRSTRTANTTREQIETEARARATELLENATKTIEREKAKALAELREEVAAMAVAIAGKVIDKNLDTAEQKRLAESFVAEVGKH